MNYYGLEKKTVECWTVYIIVAIEIIM